MSEPTIIIKRGGYGLIAIAVILVAMMHYGYSCSCVGCDLVDSTITMEAPK